MAGKTTRRFLQEQVDRIDAARRPISVSFLRLVDAMAVAWDEEESSVLRQRAIEDSPRVRPGEPAGRQLWDPTCERIDAIAERFKITHHAQLIEVLIAYWTMLSDDERARSIRRSVELTTDEPEEIRQG